MSRTGERAAFATRHARLAGERQIAKQLEATRILVGMTWPVAQRRTATTIRPGSCSILKCDDAGRRPVIANDSKTISMRTGVKTTQTKMISYEMLEYAMAVLNRTGRFTSANFRQRFGSEYTAAPCRFSMTGGVLVEIGAATLVPARREGSCSYELA